ncbi:MAG TPA: hypothetical protein PKD18_03470 [Saprospiraceae bacterium]|nr:hypothetical protein [Saprospiraceae bacterium]
MIEYLESGRLKNIQPLAWICLVWLLVIPSDVHAQVYNYDIYIDDVKAGKMEVSKSTYVNGGAVIDFSSKMKVGGIGTNEIEIYSTTYFKKGTLTDSESVVERNRRIKEQVIVKYDNSRYLVSRRNENPLVLQEGISMTMAELFYKEPVGISSVFSERYGEKCKIKFLKTGTYEIALPTGGSAVYHYDRGKCVLIESVGNIQSMTMKLKSK